MRNIQPVTGRQLGELARLLEERGVGSNEFQKLVKGKNITALVDMAMKIESESAQELPVVAPAAKNWESKLSNIFDRYIALFNRYIATLKDRGTPEQIVEALQSRKHAVAQKAIGMTIGEGNIPFLPVIKPAYLGYYGLMAMVRNGGKAGYTHLKPAAVTDQLETPDDLYYIYDVEDGSSTRGKSPGNAEKTFKSQKRSGLTVAEVMALTTHADVLSKHYVWASGSRYKSADEVPYVYLDNGDRPGLGWSYVDLSNDHWGSASCGSR